MPAGLFDDFHVDEVLSESDRTKTMAVLGRWGDKQDKAVVLLARRPFDKASVQSLLQTSLSSKLQFENDVYAKYTSLLASEQGAITVDTIYPATSKHISKHSTQKFYMVCETPQLYADKVLPFMTAIPAARIAWVYNILEKKAEADRLLFEDPDPVNGFMLHPDLKWDQTQADSLYCIALCKRRDVKSLRDLTAQHLPLLKNLKRKAYKAIKDKFGLSAQQLRAYIHYHPSYYHFHVHIMRVNIDAGPGMAAGKAHLLDDVIDNIETFGSDFYVRRTIHFTLGASDPLYIQCFADSLETNAQEPPSKRQHT